MGTWSGLALSHCWAKNPPKRWLALSPFLELCPEEGGKVDRKDLENLLASFRKHPITTLGLFEKRHGGKSVWAEGLDESDHGFLERSLEALLRPCPWTLAEGAQGVPLKVELGERDRLVTPEQCRNFADPFTNKDFELLTGKNHAIFYEDACDA